MFRDIRQHGNRLPLTALPFVELPDISNVIACRDGFRFSVIAGDGTHCRPRPGWDVGEDYFGPYTHVEVGFWDGRRPTPAGAWRPYADTRPPRFSGMVQVYDYVPVRMVYALIKHHGGEVVPAGAPAWMPERRAHAERWMRRTLDGMMVRAGYLGVIDTARRTLLDADQ